MLLVELQLRVLNVIDVTSVVVYYQSLYSENVLADVCDQVSLRKLATIHMCLNTRVYLKLERKQKSKVNIKNMIS